MAGTMIEAVVTDLMRIAFLNKRQSSHFLNKLIGKINSTSAFHIGARPAHQLPNIDRS